MAVGGRTGSGLTGLRRVLPLRMLPMARTALPRQVQQRRSSPTHSVSRRQVVLATAAVVLMGALATAAAYGIGAFQQAGASTGTVDRNAGTTAPQSTGSTDPAGDAGASPVVLRERLGLGVRLRIGVRLGLGRCDVGTHPIGRPRQHPGRPGRPAARRRPSSSPSNAGALDAPRRPLGEPDAEPQHPGDHPDVEVAEPEQLGVEQRLPAPRVPRERLGLVLVHGRHRGVQHRRSVADGAPSAPASETP